MDQPAKTYRFLDELIEEMAKFFLTTISTSAATR